jgi:SAM-dependent methyltransferase
VERIIYQKNAKLEGVHWWFVGRRRIVDHLLSRLPLNQQTKILEIGCGTGGNLQLLSRYGQVFGVEMDEDARRLAKQRSSSPILPGSLPYDIPFPGDLFDFIILMDVLEHVKEDQESLLKVRERVRNEGYIVITVPAFQFLWSRHDDLHHHKRRYTKNSLYNLIQKAGYNIVFVTYFNTLLFPVIAIVRVIKNIFKINGEDDLVMPLNIINEVLADIFSSERHLLSICSLPFGLSLLAIAKKTN